MLLTDEAVERAEPTVEWALVACATVRFGTLNGDLGTLGGGFGTLGGGPR